MNVLVLNGSPKGPQSNTLQLTRAFLRGLGQSAPVAAETLHIAEGNISPCRGCFACWTATPGRCVIRDDMDSLLAKILASDLLIWSLPLYYFGMPSQAKAVMDRTLPLLQPQIVQQADGTATHPKRYPQHNPKVVLISTCGFFSKRNNYEALEKQFQNIYGDHLTTLFCPEGELFARGELTARTEEYLLLTRQAGEAYGRTGTIGAALRAQLDKPLFEPQAFMQMANASWDIAEEDDGSAESGAGSKENNDDKCKKLRDKAYNFTLQMAATYRPASYDGRERVVELHYTDAGLACQMVLGATSCEVIADPEKFREKVTVCIETPYSVWSAIAAGEISGPQAMMDGLYKTKGSLPFMSHWDHYFYGNATGGAPQGEAQQKKSSLLPLLLVWLPLWVLLPIHALWGGIAGIAAAAAARLLGLVWQRTLYDDVGGVCVTALGLAAVLGVPARPLISLSYLCFGLLWLLSCAAKVPLTAHYVKDGYGGNAALKNPLYLKTNRILTACWGVLYVLAAAWSWLLSGSPLAPYTGLINSAAPLIMGGFTFWFQRWYPAKVAAGK